MEQLHTQVNNKYFYYTKLTAIDFLKLQQDLLQKVVVNQESMDILKSLDQLEDMAEFGTFLIAMFIKVAQGFDRNELINFMTEVFQKAKVKVDSSGGPTMVSIDRDFEENPNAVFELVVNVMKENWNFSNSSFFLKKTETKETTEGAVKVAPGRHT